MTEFIIYALIGKMIIFFVQTFPLPKLPIIGELFRSGKFLHDLVSCDLCLGFWVYLFLSIEGTVYITERYVQFPILNNIVTAMFVSFVMHLLTIGWQDKFGIINVHTE